LSRRSLARYRLIAASILFLDGGTSLVRVVVIGEVVGVDGGDTKDLASVGRDAGSESEVERVDIVNDSCLSGLFE
jgi:hypothetical protein